MLCSSSLSMHRTLLLRYTLLTLLLRLMKSIVSELSFNQKQTRVLSLYIRSFILLLSSQHQPLRYNYYFFTFFIFILFLYVRYVMPVISLKINLYNNTYSEPRIEQSVFQFSAVNSTFVIAWRYTTISRSISY